MKYRFLRETLATSCVILAACAEAPSPVAGTEALSISSADSVNGVTGELTLADTVILFETDRRPGRTHLDDGTVQPFEVVARFFDTQGMTLAAISQGHGTPEDWSMRALPQKEELEAVILAGQAIARVAFDAEVSQEVELLVSMASDLDRETEVRALMPAPKQNVTRDAPFATEMQALASSCQYYEIIELFSKKAIWNSWFNPFQYDHTATKTWYYYSCGAGVIPAGTSSQCNHGTCPSGMSRYTYGSSGWYVGNWSFPTSCHDYNSSAEWGIWGDQHLCNQDTFLEVGNVIRKKQNSATTFERICRNGRYGTYTGLDNKKRPWVGQVSNYISQRGWEYVPPPPPPTECVDGQTKCANTRLYQCVDGAWILLGNCPT